MNILFWSISALSIGITALFFTRYAVDHMSRQFEKKYNLTGLEVYKKHAERIRSRNMYYLVKVAGIIFILYGGTILLGHYTDVWLLSSLEFSILSTHIFL